MTRNEEIDRLHKIADGLAPTMLAVDAKQKNPGGPAAIANACYGIAEALIEAGRRYEEARHGR